LDDAVLDDTVLDDAVFGDAVLDEAAEGAGVGLADLGAFVGMAEAVFLLCFCGGAACA
jgi:hypothetical protein